MAGPSSARSVIFRMPKSLSDTQDVPQPAPARGPLVAAPFRSDGGLPQASNFGRRGGLTPIVAGLSSLATLLRRRLNV
jgi:hypothetical protein